MVEKVKNGRKKEINFSQIFVAGNTTWKMTRGFEESFRAKSGFFRSKIVKKR